MTRSVGSRCVSVSVVSFFMSVLCLGVALVLPARLVASDGAPQFASIGPEVERADNPGLPDGRVYELVSPANKSGNEVGEYGSRNKASFGFSAADGEAVMYLGIGALAPRSASGNENVLFVSRRSRQGWTTRSAMPIGAAGPVGKPEANNGFLVNEVAQFEPALDLSRLAFSTQGAADVGPPDELGLPGNFYLEGSDPFVEPEWLARSNPTGSGPIAIAGGSPDLRTIYFTASGVIGPSDSGFYEYRDGVLSDAGVLPAGATSNSNARLAVEGGGPSERAGSHAVSADGATAFFTRQDATGATQLYVHVTTPEGAQSSRLVSESQLPGEVGEPATDGVLPVPTTQWFTGEFGTGAGPPAYVYASADGLHAFFQSTDRLTADAPGGSAAKTYDMALSEGGRLEYLPGVVGSIVTSTADGSTVIFENTVSTPSELERWKAGPEGGSVKPVVQLPRGLESTCAVVCVGPAQLSSDGSVFVFTSDSPIVGFNDGGSVREPYGRDVGIKQIFRYVAGPNLLTCVSCPPAGVKPTGDAVTSNVDQTLNALGGSGGAISTVSDDRGMSTDDDRVFFDTPDPLVRQDVNGKRDVYEWEDGRVFLLSSGKSSRNSYFVDNSESGNDAFFTTTEGLIQGDSDEARDIYDARVPRPSDSPSPAAVPCEGEVCQGPPSTPQLLNPPASATFSGVGNLVAAAKPPARPKQTKRKVKTRAKGKTRKKAKTKSRKQSSKKATSGHIEAAKRVAK